MSPLDDSLIPRIAAATGRQPVACSPIRGGGYTPALRLLVTFGDNGAAFVKAATSDDTAAWLRIEQRVYAALGNADFLPALLGMDAEQGNDDAPPFIVLEDLSGAHWPPPWNAAQVEAVQDTLERVHAAAPLAPPDLPALSSMRDDLVSWHRVAAAPAEFLALRLCSPDWLERALPTLIAAENAAPLEGSDLLHLDVRSDNICFRPDTGAAVLVDWNWACIGNGTVDIAGWLSSLHAEGGPPPETILPGQGELAALFSGYFAFRAGQPPIPHAPRVRDVQRVQLGVALPWAARELGLTPPARQG